MKLYPEVLKARQDLLLTFIEKMRVDAETVRMKLSDVGADGSAVMNPSIRRELRELEKDILEILGDHQTKLRVVK